ncbi:hypothetical protein DL98DRAFT_516715 [Cadophora sp. DSE1049]|nr:hypothetical protein DL98DRAFT_516715 [Cadophora sp. DSE1049]
MSSLEFLDTILDSSSSVDEHSGVNFRLMLYATSLAHIQRTIPENREFDVPELLQIGSVAGHEFLKHLDEKLKPQKLAKCTGDDIRALFLLAFGTILAVGYADDTGSNATPEKQRQFKAMQEHICQILAHYVTYLGSQLGLPLASGTEQFMLEAAPEKWRKQGIFRWSNRSGHAQGFGAGADFPMFSGLGGANSQFASLYPEFDGMGHIQNSEGMCTAESENAGASVGFHYQNDHERNGWGLPPGTHATHASSSAIPDFRFGFPRNETIDPYSDAVNSAISDSHNAHLNAWMFIDSVAEEGCTCLVLAEPERTEYLLV